MFAHEWAFSRMGWDKQVGLQEGQLASHMQIGVWLHSWLDYSESLGAASCGLRLRNSDVPFSELLKPLLPMTIGAPDYSVASGRA